MEPKPTNPKPRPPPSYWAQVFNEHLLTLSHGWAHGDKVTNPYATLRIMHHRSFVNSKTFFK